MLLLRLIVSTLNLLGIQLNLRYAQQKVFLGFEGNLAACRRCADAARASKYCSEQGAKKEHSLSYVTDEQRSAE
jgi:hypothetical protein